MDAPLERSNLPPLDKNKPRTSSEKSTEAVVPVSKEKTKKFRLNRSREASPVVSSAEGTIDVEEPTAPRHHSRRRKAAEPVAEEPQIPQQDKMDSEYFDEMVRINGEMVFSDDEEKNRVERDFQRIEEERRKEEERRIEEERMKEEELRKQQMRSEFEIKKQQEEENARKRLLQEEEDLLEFQIRTLREKAIIIEETIEERRQNRQSRQQNSVGGIQIRKREEKPTLYTI